MGVSVRLGDAELRVAPGDEAVCTATLSNTGTIVDRASVEVLGPSAAWSVVEPPLLNLYPGESGEVRVRFEPPRSAAVPAGTVPFGVLVSSGDEFSESVVEEGTIEVTPFTDLRVELLPQTSRGGRRGRHWLDLTNEGNVPVGAEVVPFDPDDKLRFKLGQPRLHAEPGASVRTRFLALPRRTYLRGPVQSRPFQIDVRPERGEPFMVPGTFEQQPLVPKWAVSGLVALLAFAVVLATLWFAVVNPAIESAAGKAAKAESEKAAETVAQAKEQAARAEQKADEAVSAGAGPGATPAAPGGGNGTASPGTRAPAALTRPFDFRIQATARPRGSGFDIFTSSQQGNRPLDITDIQLQNPAGDTGILQLRRNSTVVFEFGLENFRDYDNHFVVPLHFTAGQRLRVAVRCQNPGNRQCTSSVTVSGKTR